MNVPLEWISEYIDLPTDQKILTDRLTAIGHMLDKISIVDNHPVIDLELRGNRADMFGLVGVARDISAAFSSPLRLPKLATLPAVDQSSPLIHIDSSAIDLVTRFSGLSLSVKIAPSPDFIISRLTQYGVPAINNVVDITNYVMIETGEPMHAFDINKLEGKHLILRRAKSGEKFMTIQQGQELTLSTEDLVVADNSQPVSLNIIGGFATRVTDTTKEILLEAAVYNSANVRRSSRRLKVFTEGGNRHAKHLDPENVIMALRRAIYLLQKYASAKITSDVSDYYPHPISPKLIEFPISDVFRLTGLDIPTSEISSILTRLEFKVKKSTSNHLTVTVPSFRTDIGGPADLVEEIVRIYGYDQVPSIPIASPMPIPDNYPSFVIQDRLKDILTSLGLDEVITLSLISNNSDIHSTETPITIINPPDPNMSILRPSLLPNLIDYARHQLDQNQSRSSIFEVGKVFYKKENIYIEKLHLGIAMGGNTLTPNWVEKPRALVFADLKGILDKLGQLLGVPNLIYQTGSQGNIYYAELDIEELSSQLSSYINPYSIISPFPPIIEDFNITSDKSYSVLLDQLHSLSPLISQIDLVDNYQGKLTLRISFHSPEKQLSSDDISAIRKEILKIK